jgi:hypothetical protein
LGAILFLARGAGISVTLEMRAIVAQKPKSLIGQRRISLGERFQCR